MTVVPKVVKFFNMKKFEINKKMNDSELFTLFGKYAKYHFGFYYIYFNGKDFSANNPKDLFEKVKNEYYENILCKAN